MDIRGKGVERYSLSGELLASYESYAAAGRDKTVFPSGKQCINKYVNKNILYKNFIWKKSSSATMPKGEVRDVTIKGVSFQVSSCGLIRKKFKNKWNSWSEGSVVSNNNQRIYFEIVCSKKINGKNVKLFRERVHKIVLFAFFTEIKGSDGRDFYPALGGDDFEGYLEKWRKSNFILCPDATWEEFCEEYERPIVDAVSGKQTNFSIDHLSHKPSDMRSNDIRNLELVNKKENHRRAMKKRAETGNSGPGFRYGFLVDDKFYGNIYAAIEAEEKIVDKGEQLIFKNNKLNRRARGGRTQHIDEGYYIEGNSGRKFWKRVQLAEPKDGEQWKTGEYKGETFVVSNFGRFKLHGCIVEGWKNSTEYIRFGSHGSHVAHRIVASIWNKKDLDETISRTGLSHEKLVVRHLDNDKPNNKHTNLKWGTTKENNQDIGSVKKKKRKIEHKSS